MPSLKYLSLVATAAAAAAPAAPKNPNVVMLVFDDLRPWFLPFSNSSIAAPHLTGLASSSLHFHNTYVQQAVCGPSRNSFLTGRRPSSTRTWNFKTSFRQSGLDTKGVTGDKWATLPQAFKKGGYLTLGMGKLFHPGSPANNDCPAPAAGNCPSWSTSFETNAPANITLDSSPVLTCTGTACSFRYVNPNAQINLDKMVTLANGTVVDTKPSCAALDDGECTDEWLADAAVKTLSAAVANSAGAPLFFAAGFHKPHPFWQLPQRFQDMYAELPLPKASARVAPAGMPDVAYYSCDAINGRTDFGGPYCDDPYANTIGKGKCSYLLPQKPVTDELMHHIRGAYAGGITWTDIQVGKVLRQLDALKMTDNTVVAAWTDHGWTLGEHAMFCKMGNLELHTRSWLMLRVPWKPDKMGTASRAMVELVDVFPTLAQLAGVDVSGENLEGTSLVPLLSTDAAVEGGGADALDAAFDVAYSQYPRCMNTSKKLEPPYLGNRDPCVGVPANQFTHMGYTLRTASWRYTEWPRWKADLTPDWTAIDGVELYSHDGDDGSCFDCFENVNVATDASLAPLVKKLSAMLRAAPATDRAAPGYAESDGPVDVAGYMSGYDQGEHAWF